ncbi:unnamed protein product [Mesocestoides corti]|uniref:Target of rapamycin complex subunit lst8 n=1 Tax=Mesocestoides corti TaxID=53468 RepID=A0A0R3U720_MESCO|nr:unnamed protein product [Mesocestoides corti]
MRDESSDQSISFATGGFDHIIRMWQPSTGRYIQGFDHNDSQVNALAFTSDGSYLAAAGFGKIRIYDVFGGASPVTVLAEFSKNVNVVGHDLRGNWMFSGGEDKVAKIFDWRNPTHNSRSVTGTCNSSSSINSMVLHPNQLEILFSNDNGEVYFWDLRNGQVNIMCPDIRGGPVHSIAINAEGTSLAAANASGCIIVWSLACSMAFKPTKKHSSKVHSSYALKCEFSPDSTLLATCGADGKVNLLRTADYSVTGSLRASTDRYWAWDCAFSADSRYLVSAHSDGIARLWNLEDSQNNGLVSGTTVEPRLEYKGHQRAVTCLAFRDQSLAGCTP